MRQKLLMCMAAFFFVGCMRMLPSLLNNGDFSEGIGNTPTSWWLLYLPNDPENPAQWDTDWAWDGAGKVTHLPGNDVPLVQKATEMQAPIKAGATYHFSFTVYDRTAGSVVFQTGGTEAFEQSMLITENGTSSDFITVPEGITDPYISLVPSQDFDGSISHVRIAPLNPSCIPMNGCNTHYGTSN